jgi:hypothetical protein
MKLPTHPVQTGQAGQSFRVKVIILSSSYLVDSPLEFFHPILLDKIFVPIILVKKFSRERGNKGCPLYYFEKFRLLVLNLIWTFYVKNVRKGGVYENLRE